MKVQAVVLALALPACRAAGSQPSPQPGPQASPTSPESLSVDRPQYPSTYRRTPYPPVLIRNATILTATGQEIAGGSILLRAGRIVAVGQNVDPPADARGVDGTGQVVTPGGSDSHRHVG